MTTLNYTSTAGDPALDAAYEEALATARKGRPDPLCQLVNGEWRPEGDLFDSTDPCDPSRVLARSTAHRRAS